MSQIEPVLTSLQEPRFPFFGGKLSVPSLPGLYAVYGDERAWGELGLGQPRGDSALYVGKSEDDNGRATSVALRERSYWFVNGTQVVRGAPES